MIRVLLTGTLYGDPQRRTSQAGNTFTTAKIKADGKDGAAVWCSIIAFGEQAERLATLGEGAALAVSGRAEVSAWLDKHGEPKAGMSLVVDDLATLKGRPRPPQGTGDAHRPADTAQPSRRATSAPVAAGFDDYEGWQA